MLRLTEQKTDASWDDVNHLEISMAKA